MVALLVCNVLQGFGLVGSKALVVLVSRPEVTARIEFSEVWLVLKNALGRVFFQHGFGIQNRVLFRHVHGQVNVGSAKTKLCKLKPEPFQFLKTGLTGIDAALLPEHVVSAFGHKHERKPVAPRVTIQFFTASAIHFTHTFRLLSRHYRAGLCPAARDKKKQQRKRFIQKRPIHLRAQRCPIAVFSAYKTQKGITIHKTNPQQPSTEIKETIPITTELQQWFHSNLNKFEQLYQGKIEPEYCQNQNKCPACNPAYREKCEARTIESDGHCD